MQARRFAHRNLHVVSSRGYAYEYACERALSSRSNALSATAAVVHGPAYASTGVQPIDARPRLSVVIIAGHVSAVLFDLDGTLINSQRAIIATLRHVQREHGVPESPEQDLRWALGPPLRDIVRRLLATTDPDVVERATAMYREHHPSVCYTHAAVYPGIEPALRAFVASGHRLFVATSKLESLACDLVAHFGLASAFDGICGSDLAGRRSAKTDIVAEILRAARLDAADTLMVGDRAHDIIGAKVNGVRAIAVTYGYGDRAELDAAGPDLLCDSPADIVSAVDRLARTFR